MVSDHDLGAFNVGVWARGDYVAEYASSTLAAGEAVLLARHREALRDATVEVGCGAGRITRVLAGLTDELVATDVSERMAAACRAAVPSARVEVADMRDLSALPDGHFGAVVALANVIDVVGDAERRALLAGFRRLLRPGGTLLVSSHNRGHVPQLTDPTFSAAELRTPSGVLRAARTAPRLALRRRNRRRARAFEREEPEYALVNDHAHDYALVHYYVDRDAMATQLADAGLEPLEVLDAEGTVVPAGGAAPASPTLHYAALRPRLA
ncbi:MAG: hypothetical protein QOF76_5406 [Solirubrobacteraceae bacterium]|jgi:SAM-dependent methyltransferase|nr:hypothetical protein [Solirubrobacteraceae bacterium]